MTDFKHIDVATTKIKMDSENAQVVDIRDGQSFAAGNIEGSFNLSNENLQQYIEQADMSLPLIVCCYHGISSQPVADYLAKQGFNDVYSLDGGFEAWQRSE